MITITAAVVTLGCRLNQADSSILSDRLRKAGFQIVGEDNEDSPNLIVINSCAVTATAARKTRQTLASLRRKHPYAYIVLTGCAAEISEDTVDSSDYDLLLTHTNKSDLEAKLERRFNINPPKSAHNVLSDDKLVFTEGAYSFYPFKTRANLKIQEGCNNFCSYCIVPHVRGRERSRDPQETIQDFQQLIEQGFREIVITGVNVCNYQAGGLNIVGLLRELLKVKGDYRIRLSSTEPGPMVTELVDLIAETPQLCNFLHLPLQAGNDAILKAMGRKYTCKEYKKMVDYARSRIDGVHIGSDWIIGFPGETQKHFEDACEFIKSMKFSNLHVFPFSPRKGTPAATMSGKLPMEEMMQRLETAKTIKNQAISDFTHSMIGREEVVLVERQCSETAYEGFSENYSRIRFRSKDNVLGQFCRIHVTTISEETMMLAGKQIL